MSDGQFVRLMPLRKRWARVVAIALGAYLFFGYVCIPLRVSGSSMEPTYASRGLTFCWRPGIWCGPELGRGDVVAVRLAGPSVMYLKRIVALEGETVEFRNGRLLVNDLRIEFTAPDVARAVFTARLSGSLNSGETISEAQEAEATLVKKDGVWVFLSLAAVETLAK